MKELLKLSVEEKAKAYDEAIELIKKCATDKYGCVIGIKPSDIFSELKEPDDERIRKSLIGYLKECRNNTHSEVMLGEYAKWISWLENKDNKLIPKFSIGQRIRNRKGEMPAFVIDRIENDLYKGVNGESISVVFQDDWELVEQKPTRWSEEDERIRQSLINYVYCHGNAGDFTSKEFIAWIEKQGN